MLIMGDALLEIMKTIFNVQRMVVHFKNLLFVS